MNRRMFALLTMATVAIGSLFVSNGVTTAGAVASSTNHTISITTGGTCTNFFCYTPAKLSIFQADTVTWKNTTTVAHTATTCSTSACSGVGSGTGTDAAFNSGLINPGATFTHQFHGRGTYNYYCQIHGYALMHGTITVLAFAVKTSTLPGGTVGKAYSAQLTTNGGKSPFVWTLVTGSTPGGLKLSSGGRISGTPTRTGSSTFTVKVSDSSLPRLTAQKALTIKVA